MGEEQQAWDEGLPERLGGGSAGGTRLLRPGPADVARALGRLDGTSSRVMTTNTHVHSALLFGWLAVFSSAKGKGGSDLADVDFLTVAGCREHV